MKPGQDIPQQEGFSASETLAIRLTQLATEYVALRELYESMDEGHRNRVFPPKTQESLEIEFNTIHKSLLEITKFFPR